jgi:hypothetical protein
MVVMEERSGNAEASCSRRALRVAWQRLATAWWARRHTDHPSRNSRCSSISVIARTRRRTSGTVSGIRSGSPSPFWLRLRLRAP